VAAPRRVGHRKRDGLLAPAIAGIAGHGRTAAAAVRVGNVCHGFTAGARLGARRKIGFQKPAPQPATSQYANPAARPAATMILGPSRNACPPWLNSPIVDNPTQMERPPLTE